MNWREWLTKERRSIVWNAQPLWVKIATLVIALPAWIIFAVVGVINGDIGSPYADAAFGLFGIVAALQLAYFAKALWRMDV